jgi:hypothetical protein
MRLCTADHPCPSALVTIAFAWVADLMHYCMQSTIHRPDRLGAGAFFYPGDAGGLLAVCCFVGCWGIAMAGVDDCAGRLVDRGQLATHRVRADRWVRVVAAQQLSVG